MFHLAVDAHPPHTLLVLSGELDAWTVPRLNHAVVEALGHGSTAFTVDVSAITFVGAAGMGAFVRLRNAALAAQGSLDFAAASPRFRWVSGVVGLDRVFGLADPLGEPALA